MSVKTKSKPFQIIYEVLNFKIISFFASLFNRIAEWIQETIVNCMRMKERASLIEKFLRITEFLRAENSHFSMKAVMSGLKRYFFILQFFIPFYIFSHFIKI